MPTKTENRLQMLREVHLTSPDDNMSILRILAGQHILVESDEDALRLIETGWCCWPGPTIGGGN